MRMQVKEKSDIFTFDEIERLNRLVFSPSGYSTQIKDQNNTILWEDEETIKLKGDRRGNKCYQVNFGISEPCSECAMIASLKSLKPAIKEDMNLQNNKWYQVISLPIIFKGQIVAIELIKDINDEKFTSYQLKSVNTSEKLLMDIIYHDFPNFLNNIQLALETMIIFNQDRPISDQNELLEIAAKNTKKMIEIISELRELWLLETPIGDFTPIDLVEILKQTIWEIKTSHLGKEIETNLILKIKEVKTKVMANKLLSVLILNILTNSVKHTPSKRVQLEIEINAVVKDKQYIQMKTTDFGMGIPPEIKQNLFDRNERLKKGWKPSDNSLGLGTMIIKSLIDLFQGDITYKNRIEDDWTKGTTVIILLPQALP